MLDSKWQLFVRYCMEILIMKRNGLTNLLHENKDLDQDTVIYFLEEMKRSKQHE